MARMRLLLIAMLAGVMTACQVAAPSPAMPTLTFVNLPQITLDVANIEVEDAVPADEAAQRAESAFPITPKGALRSWVDERLKAGGRDRYLRVTLKEASIHKTDLPTRQGFSGLFYDEQSERYDARIEVHFAIIGDDAFHPLATVVVEVKRSQSFAEGLTLNERHERMIELVESLMRDYDAEAERQIRAHFTRYLM